MDCGLAFKDGPRMIPDFDSDTSAVKYCGEESRAFGDRPCICLMSPVFYDDGNAVKYHDTDGSETGHHGCRSCLGQVVQKTWTDV
jgi:hypothetical protein